MDGFACAIGFGSQNPRFRGLEGPSIRGLVLGLFDVSLDGCLTGRQAGWLPGWLACWLAGRLACCPEEGQGEAGEKLGVQGRGVGVVGQRLGSGKERLGRIQGGDWAGEHRCSDGSSPVLKASE